MIMSALVSIVVGVYNGERYLAELLDSILSQTSSDWECVCVNDGSSDSSGNVLASYADKDSRFKIVTRRNGGVGAARNSGMDVSDSKYVMFADQDDKLLPNAVATALSAIEGSGCDVVRFQSNRHLPESPFVWERIYRRSAISSVRFPPITGGEDTAFFWELDFLGLKTCEISDELYWNRPNNGSFSRDVTPKYIQNVFAGFEAMWQTGLRHRAFRLKLFFRLFPHVFWLSVSVIIKHSSRANIKALLTSLVRIIFPRHEEVSHV